MDLVIQGGAEERQQIYVDLVQVFLDAGSCLYYPGQPDSDAYLNRLLEDAAPKVKILLRAASDV